jgi:hypothetical protein
MSSYEFVFFKKYLVEHGNTDVVGLLHEQLK